MDFYVRILLLFNLLDAFIVTATDFMLPRIFIFNACRRTEHLDGLEVPLTNSHVYYKYFTRCDEI
jgi:hypothetical protein